MISKSNFIVLCAALLYASLPSVAQSLSKAGSPVVNSIKETDANGASRTMTPNNSGTNNNGGAAGSSTVGVVGTLPGTASVGPDGSASYTIPIFCSPGTNGMQPNLSISYNSSHGNGMMGLGWSIGGLSAITRGGKDIEHFGQNNNDGVDLDTDDKFYFNGQLLLALNGAKYGDPNTEYQTEINSFGKITSHGQVISPGSGPEYFTILTKEGLTLDFGNTTDSKVVGNSQGTKLMWLLNKVTDANGNYMTFTYNALANREHLISEINYTGNSLQGFTPYAKIAFTYSNKPVFASRYIAGNEIASTKLLNKIECTYLNQLVRKFEFGYTNRAVTNEDLLSTIDCMGSNSDKLNQTTIEWHSANSNSINISQVLPQGVMNAIYYHTVGDFDGNGVDDFISMVEGTQFASDIFSWSLFDRNGHEMSSGNQQIGFNDIMLGHAKSADLDGDGKDELIFVNAGGPGTFPIRAYSYNGSGFVQLPDVAWVVLGYFFYGILPGDFDGDGKDELFIYSGTGLSGTKYYKIVSYSSQTQTFSYLSQGTINNDDHKAYVIDFNGDGKKEILSIFDGSGSVKSEVYEFNYNGSAYVANTIYQSGYPSNYHEVFPCDFNGDGKTDLMTWNSNSYYTISFGTGTNFTPDVAVNNIGEYTYDPNDDPRSHNLVFGDFNGDGRTDFVNLYAPVIGSGGYGIMETHYSKGDGYFSKVTYPNQFTDMIYDTGLNSGDFNGDGRSDIIHQKLTYIWHNGGKQWHYYELNLMDFHKNEKSNLVHKINNSSLITTKFEFEFITTPSVYTKGSGAIFPVLDLIKPLYVTSSLSQFSNATGSTYYVQDEDYKYYGAKLHLQGKGLLCFSKIVTTDTKKNTIKETNYDFSSPASSPVNAPYYFPLKTSEFVKDIITGTSIGKEEIQYNFHSYYNSTIASNNLYYIFRSNVKEYDDLKGITKETDYDFDADGNIKQEIVNYNSGHNITNNFIFSSFGNNGLIPNKVSSKETIVQYPNSAPYTTQELFQYDYTTGNVLQEKFIPENSANHITKDYSYLNACGLPESFTVSAADDVAAVVPGGPTPPTIVTYASYDNLFRFTETKTNALGQVAYLTNDLATGDFTGGTDIDGLQTRHTYDGFGKLIFTQLPRGIINYTYDWNNGNTVAGTAVTEAVYYMLKQESAKPYVKEYYDAVGRVVCSETIKLKQGTSTGIVFKERYYDSNTNRLIKESGLFYSGGQQQYTDFEYDDFGRLTKVQEPTGNITTTSYNGLVISKSFPNGTTEEKTYDPLGNVKAVTDRTSSNMEYDYYSNGKLKNVHGDNGSVYMTYDNFGRQMAMDDPDAGTTEYVYDAYGRLIQQKDANGNTFKMNYNLLGQITEKLNSNNATEFTKWIYNNTAATPEINKPQEIIYSSPLATVTKFSYEYQTSVGDLTKFTQDYNSGGRIFETSYSYDTDGNLTQSFYRNISDNISLDVRNTYDVNNLGKVVDIREYNSQKAYWIFEEEDAYGKPLKYFQGTPNTNISTFTYDPVSQMPSSIEFKINSNTNWRQDYVFDVTTGNLTSRTDPTRNLTENFSYEYGMFLKGRQSAADPSGDFNMDISGNGNIDNNDIIGDYDYHPTKLHAVVNVTDKAFTPGPGIPDARKNISSLEQNITYNSSNKVLKISEGPHMFEDELEFEYGPDNERIVTHFKNYSNGQVTNTVDKYFFGNYERTEDQNARGKDIFYIYSPYGLCAAHVEERTFTGLNISNHYIRTDYLSSIMYIVDDAGNLTEENSYDAWGRRRNPFNWLNYNANNPNPPALYLQRGYTGHEHLEKFALINMNGRLYDPVLCRMLSPDNFNTSPYEAVGYNRYAYVLNNPLYYVDPSGHTGEPYSFNYQSYSYNYSNIYSYSGMYGGIPYSYSGYYSFQTTSYNYSTTYSNVYEPYNYTYSYNYNDYSISLGTSASYGEYTYGYDVSYSWSNYSSYLSGVSLNPEYMKYINNLNSDVNNNLILYSGWVGNTNDINGGIGVLAGAVENLSGEVTLGSNLKPYPSGWGGNQYVSTIKAANVGKIVGYGTLALGTVVDGVGVYNYYKYGANDPNAVHPGKAGLNLSVGAWSLINPATAICGVWYYGIDTFYPGGWNNAMYVAAGVQARDRAILGYYPKD